MKTFGLSRPDLKRWLDRDRVLTTVLLMNLVVVEIGGRSATNDVHDLLFGILLVVVLVLTFVFNETKLRRRFRRVAVRLRRLGEALAGAWFHLDLDLRGRPPLRRAVPSSHVRVLILTVGGAVVAGFLAAGAPSGFRDVLSGTFYTGYVAVMLVVWAVMLIGIVFAAFLPMLLIRHASAAERRLTGLPSILVERLIGLSYVIALVLAATFLPVVVALGALVAAWAVGVLCVALPGGPRLDLLWWPSRDRKEGPFSITWGWFAAVQMTALAAVAVALSLLTTGEGLRSSFRTMEFGVMPLTTSIGIAFAWATAATAVSCLGFFGRLCVIRRFLDPARRVRPRVVVAGAFPREVRRAVRAALRPSEFRVVFSPRRRRRTDVEIDLGETAHDAFSTWPLPLRIEDLEAPDVRRRLLRRDQIQRRRAVMTGLERLFKIAASLGLSEGEGFWLAPHQWFLSSMERDGDEDSEELSSPLPPYHRVLPHAATSHLHEVLTALDVDLIFVEDGVGFRHVRRVFRLMFDHFDTFGGARRIEELHLVGIPGVRAMVLDFTFENPFRSEVYPEPDYEFVGRARILHLFRDRGGEESRVESPSDVGARPVLSC